MIDKGLGRAEVLVMRFAAAAHRQRERSGHTYRMLSRTQLLLTGCILVAAGALSHALAQQAPPVQQPRPTGKSSTSSARAAPSAKEEAANRGGDGAMRQRVEHLEEQMVDMQVTIGTLESLARPGGGGSSASSPSAARAAASSDADQVRIETLETQVRALTNQLEQMAEQLRQLSGRRSEAGGMAGTLAERDASIPPRGDMGGGYRQGGVASADPGRPVAGGFGSTTITPQQPGRDPIGNLITTDPEPARDQPGRGATAGNPKELYETAYGYLLQQDYGAAEVAFEEFLRANPNDRLAADAQYWLGESLYVQRRYKPAAQSFLKVVQTYPASAKVPNSLLKLAMTLEQLGQKDCALFTDLDSRANATPDIKSKARVVRQRVGC